MADTEVVTFRLILEVDCPEQAQAFGTWAAQIGLDTDTLENDGCGCCVDIYTVSTTPEHATRLERLLDEVGSGIEYLPG